MSDVKLKRFSICGNDMYRREDRTGPFVDADVAEALYEALEYQRRMQDGDASCSLLTFLHMRDDALAKARGQS